MRKLYLALLLLIFTGTARAQNSVTGDSNTKESGAQRDPSTYQPQAHSIQSVSGVSLSSVGTSQELQQAGFPQFIDTGNADKDNATYNEAKQKWVSENKELYDQLNTQPASNPKNQ